MPDTIPPPVKTADLKIDLRDEYLHIVSMYSAITEHDARMMAVIRRCHAAEARFRELEAKLAHAERDIAEMGDILSRARQAHAVPGEPLRPLPYPDDDDDDEKPA